MAAALSVHAVVLLLLHLADNAWRTARLVLHHVRQRLDGLVAGLGDAEGTEARIRRAVAETKPLHHLAVILDQTQEEASVGDVVKLAVWARAAGTAYVSVYDPWGRHKQRPWRSALDEALVHAGLPPSRTPGGPGGPSPGVDGGLCGVGRDAVPRVTLLDVADGKVAIARAARGLCQEALDGGLTSADVTMELLHERIIEEASVPEPELAVYCGDVMSLHGFLPWHCRITTFLPLPSTRVSLRTFLGLLQRFGGCKQRMGR